MLYTANGPAFNFLASKDPLANPISYRPYARMNDDFFITAIGDTNITMLGKLMYYQNMARQEKTQQTTVQGDINETKNAFDINKKVSYVLQNYLTKDNDQ